MIKLKQIHIENGGYKNIFSVDDNQLDGKFNQIFKKIASFPADKAQNYYLYFLDEDKPVFLKLLGDLKVGIYDANKEMLNDKKYSSDYPASILFNEALYVMDNSNDLGTEDINANRDIVFTPQAAELRVIPYILDILATTDKSIAIGHSDLSQLKKIISYSTGLLPVSLARKISMAVNCSYVSVANDLNKNIRVFGYTGDSFDSRGLVDIYIRADRNSKIDYELSSFGKYLSTAKDTNNLKEKSTKLMPLFDNDGDYKVEEASYKLARLIYDELKTEDSLIDLLEIYNKHRELIDNNWVNRLAHELSSKDKLKGRVKSLLKQITQNEPDLKDVNTLIEATELDEIIEKLPDISKKDADLIVERFTMPGMKISAKLENALMGSRTSIGLDIVFRLYLKYRADNTLDLNKNFFINYFNHNTAGLRSSVGDFSSFICNKLKSFEGEDRVALTSIFLYSIAKDGSNINERGKRRLEKLETALYDELKCINIDIVDLVCKIYNETESLLNLFSDNPDDDYENYQLFTEDFLRRITNLEIRDFNLRITKYYDLMKLVIDRKCDTYLTLKSIIRDTVEGTQKGEPLYKSLATAEHIEDYKNFYDSLEVRIPDEIKEYIREIGDSAAIADELSEYRISFTYNCYLASSKVSKKKILKALEINYDNNADNAVKELLNSNNNELKHKAMMVIANVGRSEKNYIVDAGTPVRFYRIITIAIAALLCASLLTFLFVLPLIIKASLLNRNIITVLAEETTILTPIVFVYTCLMFIGFSTYFLYRNRRNLKQSIGNTIKMMLVYALYPEAVYIALWSILYFCR